VTPPALDCHAHIAPDVTIPQLQQLGGAHVLAVTRTLDEAALVARRPPDDTVTWGLGDHPAVESSYQFDADRFARLLPSFALVGEVGLDGRGKNLAGQILMLRTVLELCADQSVLISVHSSRAVGPLTELIVDHPHPGLILHWYLGQDHDLATAIRNGAYFSINNAMNDRIIAGLPMDRVLPETDFVRPGLRGHQPGDTAAVVKRLAQLWGVSTGAAQHQCWTNLRRLAVRSGALDRLPGATAQLLLEL
jgi:TatD DNase family protein